MSSPPGRPVRFQDEEEGPDRYVPKFDFKFDFNFDFNFHNYYVLKIVYFRKLK